MLYQIYTLTCNEISPPLNMLRLNSDLCVKLVSLCKLCNFYNAILLVEALSCKSAACCGNLACSKPREL